MEKKTRKTGSRIRTDIPKDILEAEHNPEDFIDLPVFCDIKKARKSFKEELEKKRKDKNYIPEWDRPLNI